MPSATPIKGRRRRGGGLIIILQPRIAMLLKEFERLKLYEEIMCDTASPLTEEEIDGYPISGNYLDSLEALEAAVDAFASAIDTNIVPIREANDIIESNLP